MKHKFRISVGLCILAAFLLLMLPLQWCAAMLLAAAFHELCHYAAVRLCGGSVWGIILSSKGAKMETAPMSRGRELVCALAGPLGGLLLLLFARWIPRTALCAGMQSMYNLLPVSGLDGGRALRCGAEMLFSQAQAEAICIWAERICVLCVLILGVYGSFVLRLGLLPLLAAVFLVLRTQNGKIPCKRRAKAVQ